MKVKSGGTEIQSTIDANGFQTSLDDKNAGITNYLYNGCGDILLPKRC